jgi:hypothetical protein
MAAYQDLSNKDLHNTSEVSSLRDENRKLRADSVAEIKLLQNKVLIAEEKSKVLLDQYTTTVAPLEVKKEFWKRELDEPSTYKSGAPYIFDLPLSAPLTSDYHSQPYNYDRSFYREPLPRSSYMEQPSMTTNLYESAPLKRYLDREPSPIYRPAHESPLYSQSFIGRSFVSSEKPLRPTSPLPNIRTYLAAEVSRSRDSGMYLPRGRAGTGAPASVGDDYLGRLSGVYPGTVATQTSVDRGSVRRLAVADAGSHRQRPGESFLSEFRHKMQAINL